MPRNKSNNKERQTNIRKDLVELIDLTFPDGLVEMTQSPDDCYLVDLLPQLRAKLRRIAAAQLVYERELDPAPEWADGDDSWDDLPVDTGLSASYHVFFISLSGQEFTYATESEGEGEDGEVTTVRGEGQLGCVLAVSGLAPLAVVEFSTIEHFEDGSSTMPDIAAAIPTEDSESNAPGTLEEQSHRSQSEAALQRLRDQMLKALVSLGIALLPDDEARKPVPWLTAGEDAFVGGDPPDFPIPITVQDAFFFQRP